MNKCITGTKILYPTFCAFKGQNKKEAYLAPIIICRHKVPIFNLPQCIDHTENYYTAKTSSGCVASGTANIETISSLSNGGLSYWHMDHTISSVSDSNPAVDELGNVNFISGSFFSTLPRGKSGGIKNNCITFVDLSGEGGVPMFADTNFFNFGSNDFTIAGWIRQNTIADSGIFQLGNTSPIPLILSNQFSINGPLLRASINTTEFPQEDLDLLTTNTDNEEWHFVSIRKSGQWVWLNHDSLQQQFLLNGTTLQPATDRVWAGRGIGSFSIYLDMDQWGVWNRKLTDDEINRLALGDENNGSFYPFIF